MRSSSDPGSVALAPTIVAEDLSVRYGDGAGPWALRGFSAVFGEGITALLGPNGAGKTTFLRTLADCVHPTRGRVVMGNAPPASYRTSHGLGFLPEDPPLPSHLTVLEFLAGLPDSNGDGSVLNDPGGRLPPSLEELAFRTLDTLSLGQKKKVALRAALLGRPSVLLLDEPTNGLDPLALNELRETLLAEDLRRTVILISSHHLDELQRVADAFVFIQEGRVLGSWSREEALDAYPSLEALYNHHFRGEGDV